jgi:hypothetical protein
MRKSSIFINFTAGATTLFLLSMLHATHRQHKDELESSHRATLVKELKLTDLCLFTEARYTRHPAMADLHSPFQEHPTALEHFPSGSLVSPPVALMRPHAESR